MRVAVVDTSALLRLFVPDGPIPEGLEDTVLLAARSEAVLMTPELVLAEVVQVLRKKEAKGFLTDTEVDEIVDALMELPLEVVGHRSLLAESTAIARTTGLTAYDALFLALAGSRQAELFTADAALESAWVQQASRAKRAQQA